MPNTYVSQTGTVLFNGQEFIVRDSEGFNLGVCGGYLGIKLLKSTKKLRAKEAVAACVSEDRYIAIRQTAPNVWTWAAS